MGRHGKRIGATLAVAAVTVLGLAHLPAPEEPVRVRSAVLIERAPADVFAFVTTPANWPRWHPSSLGVAGATDHALEVGEQVTEDYRVAGREGRAVWTVTQRDTPRRWRIEGRGESGGQAWITYRLAPLEHGTYFEREMRYRMPTLLTALLDPLLARQRIEEESALALRRLKAVLEADGQGVEGADTVQPTQ